MEKNPHIRFNEVLAGSSEKKLNRQISTWVNKGLIRKIAPRLYSPNFDDPPAEIIRRNLFEVLSLLYPGAMLSHRSAFEFEPTGAGHLFLTHSYTRKVVLPGITLRFLEGPGPVEGDRFFSGQLRVSQEARAFLENFQAAKGAGAKRKILPLLLIEEKLETIIRIKGEEALNKLRDRARALAKPLGMEEEFERMDALIGALLATRDSGVLSIPRGEARARGVPYDPDRVLLFQDLFRELEAMHFPLQKDPNRSHEAFRNFAFFESYFSNYIEGTEFELDVARQIIESNTPLPARNEDSHDILGTYQLASNPGLMSELPGSGEELLSVLKDRHSILLRARHEKEPGSFKKRNNRAGNTLFVDWNLVEGTLIRAYEIYQALNHPFKRAAFMLFLVSEVHPFIDGNGRVARIMMNAELVAGGQAKILIPTVYRDDYLGALRTLTRRALVAPYLRMLQRIYDFSLTVRGEDLNLMQDYLESCNAFQEPTEASLHF
ncbi:MAG: cell filamentation protein Fic [Bacteroidetes bacterium]|nr:MAG: cell filamentation protein Fic [Bacteroidota bacterium]RLD90301.1 MAG: cell filamentation protein Fic [Bacteroidota bacterium]